MNAVRPSTTLMTAFVVLAALFVAAAAAPMLHIAAAVIA